MDNLTHTLAGAALGEAGLKTRTRLGMAALMIGANLPDLDVLAIPYGEALTFRRGWTHGPLAMLALPVLLTLLLLGWARLRRRGGPAAAPDAVPLRPRQLLLLSFVGVLSHPALDWLNSYGVRLLMPFSARWFHGDSIFIVDPWIWLALGLGVALSRWRGRRRPGGAPRAARVAVGAVCAYVGLMILGSRSAHGHAVRHMTAVAGRPPERVMAGPVPVDPLRRTLIHDMGDAYRFGTLAWRPAPTIVLEAVPLPTLARHPAVLAAMERREVRDFLRWSRFPFFVVEEAAVDSLTVHAADARFSRRPGGWSGVTVRVPRAETPERPGRRAAAHRGW